MKEDGVYLEVGARTQDGAHFEDDTMKEDGAYLEVGARTLDGAHSEGGTPVHPGSQSFIHQGFSE